MVTYSKKKNETAPHSSSFHKKKK